jgi:multisubunit Na+/H+ antiporter MnhF subunit
MNDIMLFALYGSLLIHIILIGITTWYIWQGENIINRLVSLELLGTLVLAVLVLVAIMHGQILYIDVALGLAALGFIGMVAVARYIADQQMF